MGFLLISCCFVDLAVVGDVVVGSGGVVVGVVGDVGRDIFRFRLRYLRFGTYKFIDNIVANCRGSSTLD